VWGVLESFVDMCSHEPSPTACYVNDFERPHLEQTASYYQAECQSLFERLDLSSAMVKILQRLDEEKSR